MAARTRRRATTTVMVDHGECKPVGARLRTGMQGSETTMQIRMFPRSGYPRCRSPGRSNANDPMPSDTTKYECFNAEGAEDAEKEDEWMKTTVAARTLANDFGHVSVDRFRDRFLISPLRPPRPLRSDSRADAIVGRRPGTSILRQLIGLRVVIGLS